jgi:hypothetical protein
MIPLSVSIDAKRFNKEINNIMQYSIGFIEGVQRSKTVFFENIGSSVIEAMKEFVDSNARVNPSALQHMYEWGQAGSPAARLFDINYTVTNLGLSLDATFRQSSSVRDGSSVPFYDKARIMEQGIPVTIKPVRARVLSFDVDGNPVFTSGPVTVQNPGGEAAEGSFENAVSNFVKQYFTQSFLKSSGLTQYFSYPSEFKKGLARGKTGGRASGLAAGARYMSRAGAGI